MAAAPSTATQASTANPPRFRNWDRSEHQINDQLLRDRAHESLEEELARERNRTRYRDDCRDLLRYLGDKKKDVLQRIEFLSVRDFASGTTEQTTALVKLLKQCTSLQRFEFGYCVSCHECHAPRLAWAQLMSLQGIPEVVCTGRRQPAHETARLSPARLRQAARGVGVPGLRSRQFWCSRCIPGPRAYWADLRQNSRQYRRFLSRPFDLRDSMMRKPRPVRACRERARLRAEQEQNANS